MKIGESAELAWRDQNRAHLTATIRKHGWFIQYVSGRLCDAPGWSASAGTFRVDASGKAYVELTTAARRGQYDGIRVLRRTRDASGRAGSQLVLSASIS